MRQAIEEGFILDVLANLEMRDHLAERSTSPQCRQQRNPARRPHRRRASSANASGVKKRCDGADGDLTANAS
jgi:hypothetical protein